MVKLVPMSEPGLQRYLAHAIPDYAQEKVKAGNWQPDVAVGRSRETFQKLLPEGAASPGQHLFTILEESQSRDIGMIWFAEIEGNNRRSAFIYDFVIDEAFRGKGYGKAAMLAVEDKVKELGIDSISLHVFGHNRVARALYEKLGYEITNINMTKTLKPE